MTSRPPRPSRAALHNYNYTEEPRLHEWLQLQQNVHTLQSQMDNAELDVGLYASFLFPEQIEALVLYMSSGGIRGLLWISPWTEEAVFEDPGIIRRFSNGEVQSANSYDDSGWSSVGPLTDLQDFVDQALGKMDALIRRQGWALLKDRSEVFAPPPWTAEAP